MYVPYLYAPAGGCALDPGRVPDRWRPRRRTPMAVSTCFRQNRVMDVAGEVGPSPSTYCTSSGSRSWSAYTRNCSAFSSSSAAGRCRAAAGHPAAWRSAWSSVLYVVFEAGPITRPLVDTEGRVGERTRPGPFTSISHWSDVRARPRLSHQAAHECRATPLPPGATRSRVGTRSPRVLKCSRYHARSVPTWTTTRDAQRFWRRHRGGLTRVAWYCCTSAPVATGSPCCGWPRPQGRGLHIVPQPWWTPRASTTSEPHADRGDGQAVARRREPPCRPVGR